MSVSKLLIAVFSSALALSAFAEDEPSEISTQPNIPQKTHETNNLEKSKERIEDASVYATGSFRNNSVKQ